MALKRKSGKTEFTRLREQAGLTLAEAEALLKVDRRTVYRYERGETKPSKLARDIIRQAAEKRVTQDNAPPSFRFIDLFAGIGGLRMGFEPAGGRCVFTSEWDPKCQEMYRLNYPDNHEIADVVRRQEEKFLLIGEVTPNSMDQMALEIIRRRMSFEQLRQGYESLPPEARPNAKAERPLCTTS
jgi:DNA (cytosine-5)-methyltransferase 1